MACNAKKKTRTIVLAVILAILLLAFIAVIWTSDLMFHFALNPNSDYTMENLMQSNPEDSGGPTSSNIEDEEAQFWEDYYKQAAQWFDGGQRTTLISEDGLNLNAYYFPQAESHRYAVVCHGYGGNAAQMAGSAMQFYEMGCSVLMPDARAHGESEGDYYGMGWLERKDLLGWIDQLVSADPDAQIVLFGISMGGATVMMTAGEQLPEQVKCIIEDCGYTSVWDEFSLQLQTLFGMPEFPLLYTADLVCRLRAGYGFQEASSVEQLKKAEVPMLFIHGEEDTFVPYSMLDQVYDACASTEKERLSIPGAGHGAASSVEPELYWNTVESFMNKYFR